MDFYKETFKAWKDWPSIDKSLKQELLNLDDETAREVFSAQLQFGTSGLRGIMGVGTNRMNLHVIDHVTRALAKYIHSQKKLNMNADPKVVIAYDSRHNSRNFAERTAKVLSDAGIEVFLFSALVPVSVLSFAIRKLACDYGIMITASHNGKEYNGYKVYNSLGGQILPDEANAIHEFIDKEEFFAEEGPFILPGRLFGKGQIHQIYDEVMEDFIAKTVALDTKEKVSDLRIIYSPLNGTGLVPVRESLSRIGVGEIIVVADQEQPDGDFPTCPQPNPELAQVYQLGLDLLKEKDGDLLIVTDPDCDRTGMATKDHIFTGNEIAMLLFDYLCKRALTKNDLFAARSIVSSPMLDKIAETYNIGVRETLIGFKYIAELVDQEERNFFFGFEEGNGYMAATHVRDKDGVSTAMLLAEMAAYYKEEGTSLTSALKSLHKEYGNFAAKVISFHFAGLAGQERREKIMQHLKDKRDKEGCDSKWFGMKPTAIVDYGQQEILTAKGVAPYEDLPEADIMELRYPGEKKIIIRPSGTEPKLKAYLMTKGRHEWKTNSDLAKMDQEVSDFIYNIQNHIMEG